MMAYFRCQRYMVFHRKCMWITIGLLSTFVLFRIVVQTNRPKNLHGPEHHRQVFNTHGLNKSRGYAYLSSLARQGNISYGQVATYSLPGWWLSESDLKAVTETPVSDIKRVATASTSSLYVHSVSKSGQLTVGDSLTVRLDLRDSQGRAVQDGGHAVRLWMLSSGSKTFQPTLSKAAAADVTDLGNGSYTASVPVLWPGTTTLRAALVRPREFRGLMLRLLNKMKSLLPITAAFVHYKHVQITLCHPTPIVPGFSQVCNFTRENYALPWYCGKPTKAGLNCSHWVETRCTDFPLTFSLSGAERGLFGRYFKRDMTQGPYRTIDAISPGYTFTATNGTLPAITTPCSLRKPRDTWTDQSPIGFWDKRKWKPLKCSLPDLTSSSIDRCLHNTTVLFLGDSNARTMLETLRGMWHCKFWVDGPSQHDPHHCDKLAPGVNARITWYPHAYPFVTKTSWTSRFNKRPPSHYMAKIPSTGNYVVLIHLYAHFLAVHSYILGLHVRDAARGVHDLLSRNPRARVFVRGPHAMDGGEKSAIGDLHAERTAAIFRQEFRDLADRVVYLDVWGMTVASMNKEIHPPSFVTGEIVRLFLGHLCGPTV